MGLCNYLVTPDCGGLGRIIPTKTSGVVTQFSWRGLFVSIMSVQVDLTILVVVLLRRVFVAMARSSCSRLRSALGHLFVTFSGVWVVPWMTGIPADEITRTEVTVFSQD